MRTVILVSGLLIADSINSADVSTAVATFVGIVLLCAMTMDVVEFFSKK